LLQWGMMRCVAKSSSITKPRRAWICEGYSPCGTITTVEGWIVGARMVISAVQIF
jgi:hypothetical protein